MSEHDELGLFDEPARARVPRPRRAVDGEPMVVVTNDMDVVEDVLHTARTAGYVQVGGRVCRDSGADPEPVGEFEAAVVGQLIGTGLLQPGRVGRDGARPVEVPAPRPRPWRCGCGPTGGRTRRVRAGAWPRGSRARAGGERGDLAGGGVAGAGGPAR